MTESIFNLYDNFCFYCRLGSYLGYLSFRDGASEGFLSSLDRAGFPGH